MFAKGPVDKSFTELSLQQDLIDSTLKVQPYGLDILSLTQFTKVDRLGVRGVLIQLQRNG